MLEDLVSINLNLGILIDYNWTVSKMFLRTHSTSQKVVMSSFIKAQKIILRLTEVGSKAGVFTKFTSKLTVISGNAMYYDSRFLGDSLRRLTARQLSKESIYLSGHPSVFYTTEFFLWVVRTIFCVLLAVSWIPPTTWMTVQGY